jgi:hypothetical protein
MPRNRDLAPLWQKLFASGGGVDTLAAAVARLLEQSNSDRSQAGFDWRRRVEYMASDRDPRSRGHNRVHFPGILTGVAVSPERELDRTICQSIFDGWLPRNCQVGGAGKDLRPRP